MESVNVLYFQSDCLKHATYSDAACNLQSNNWLMFSVQKSFLSESKDIMLQNVFGKKWKSKQKQKYLSFWVVSKVISLQ